MGSGYKGSLTSSETIILRAIGRKACSMAQIREKTKVRFGRLSTANDIIGIVKKMQNRGLLKRYWTPDGVPRYFSA